MSERRLIAVFEESDGRIVARLRWSDNPEMESVAEIDSMASFIKDPWPVLKKSRLVFPTTHLDCVGSNGCKASTETKS